MQECGELQSTAGNNNKIVQNIVLMKYFQYKIFWHGQWDCWQARTIIYHNFCTKKNSPLTKDLTEDDGGKGTAHAQCWSQAPPGVGTWPCSAPQTPAASGYNSPPAPGASCPPPRRSSRQTRGRPPRPASRGQASLSTGHRHRWG